MTAPVYLASFMLAGNAAIIGTTLIALNYALFRAVSLSRRPEAAASSV